MEIPTMASRPQSIVTVLKAPAPHFEELVEFYVT